MSNKWWISILKGVILLALGVVLLQIPELNRTDLYLATGSIIAILGIITVMVAARFKPRRWGLLVAEGSIDFLLGIALVSTPWPRELLLPVFLGVWSAIGGLNQIISAVRLATRGFNQWWVILVLGLGALTLGGLILSYNLDPSPTIILILSILFIVFGLLQILVKFTIDQSNAREALARERKDFKETEGDNRIDSKDSQVSDDDTNTGQSTRSKK